MKSKVDDRKSSIQKEIEVQILNVLRNRITCSGTKNRIIFTDYIDFLVDSQTKKLSMAIHEKKFYYERKIVKTKYGYEMNPVCQNMQTDYASFEAWALCLKYWLSDQIETVSLRWDEPQHIDVVRQRHYNRFLYRVLKMQEHFEWFSIEAEKTPAVRNFQTELESGNLYLNIPRNEASTPQKESSEATIERSFISRKELFKGVDFDACGNQLPVGVFRDSVSNTNALFTGGKSAIDLWAIRSDELWIFELKYRNKKIGILTELLFYLWLMEDLCLNHTIHYGPYTDKTTMPRNFDKFYDRTNGDIAAIHGVLLIDELHPAISPDLLAFINREDRNKRSTIHAQYYKCQSDKKIILL